MTSEEVRGEMLRVLENSMEGWLDTFIETVLEDVGSRRIIEQFGETKVRARLFLAMKRIADKKLDELLPQLKQEALGKKQWKLFTSSTSEDDS